MIIRIAPLVIAFCLLSGACMAVASDDIQKVPLGDLEIMAIIDAQANTAPDLIPNLDQHPEFSGLFSRGDLPSVFKTYLFKTGGHVVLVDSGWGEEQQVKGNTRAILEREGIPADAVTDILLTHLDWDHIGGLTKSDQPVFANATLWIAKPEYDAWIKGELPGRPEFAREKARKLANIYKDKIRLFSFGEEILPGVKALDASGHTPGHTAFEISSASQKMDIVGDLLHLWQVQLSRPDLSSKYDNDPQRAAGSRERLLEDAVQKNALFAGMHFPMISDVKTRPDGGFMMREPR